MAASPTAVPSPNTDGGNALAALLAAAAASMHRQQNHHHHQQQQQQQQQTTYANANTEVHRSSIANTSYTSNNNNKSYGNISSPRSSKETSGGGMSANFNNNHNYKSKSTTKQQPQANSSDKHKGNNMNSSSNSSSSIIISSSSENMNQTIQQELEAKRDTLCQLLNLKPASSLIDSTPTVKNRSPANAPPLTNCLNNCNNNNNKRSTSSSPSSVNQLLFSSKSKMPVIQHNHNHHHFQAISQNGLDKSERSSSKKQAETMIDDQHDSAKSQLNGIVRVPVSYSNNESYKEPSVSVNGQHKKQATNKSINNVAAIATGTTTKTRNKNNHKSSTSSSSSISNSTDKDSNCATKLIVSLVNGIPSSSSKRPATESADHLVEMRNLESWHDDGDGLIDDSCYEELVDASNSNGWSADEMFKYNEKMHKITSSYNEKTLSDNYTTPLRKINSRTTMLRVSQLAKEIEDRVIAEGRITPESSDDDELFETERMQRVQLKQKSHLGQKLKNLQRQNQQQHRFSMMNNISSSKTTQSSSQYSNSTETPATVSLSSSPTLNDTIIRPVTSSSRNILRACLT